MGIIYMFGGSHKSDFHNVTQYGSKMCHRSVTGVTGVTQPGAVHDILPNCQMAQMCLWFTALKHKLGEIDHVHAIYAHVSQFCDPCVCGGQILG